MSDDGIRVICDSTEDREKRAMETFEKIRPYLEEGFIYSKAFYKAGIVNNLNGGWMNYRWCRDVIEYGETQGYPYKKYSGKGGGHRK